MRPGGTSTRKRLTAAGGTAILAGMATAALGLTAGPAAADAQAAVSSTFKCTGAPVDLDVDVDVVGTLPASVQEGDKPSLSGFQVKVDVGPATADALRAAGITSLEGGFTDFPVASSNNDVPSKSVPNPGKDGTLTIGHTTVPLTGRFSFASPASAINVGPFEANQPGLLTVTTSAGFAAELTLGHKDGEPTTASLTCTGSMIEIDSVDVKEKATPPTSTPTATTNPQGPDKPGEPSNDNSPTPSGTQTTTPSGTGNDNDTTPPPQARPELANTGMPYTIPMTATGSALVLLGAGMVVLSRRRAMTAALVSDEAGDGADTSKD